MLPTLSPRQKAGLACALALLLWMPMGVSHGDATLITGHSSFYDGDVFSPCLASLAGIMRHRVMWFNDQVLVETYGGKGTFIYVTETGAPDPRAEETLYSDGVFYDFVDPNGAHWHVEELYYDQVDEVKATIDRTGPVPTVRDVSLAGDRITTWVVELSARPIFDEFNGDSPHTYYNFLTIVDTCKMHNNTATYDGEEWHDASDISPDTGHRADDDAHGHGRFMVDIWAGKRPVSVINGANTSVAVWETEWAQGEARQTAPDTADGGTTPEAP